MVMFLALHPMESISLNSFVLLEHLAISLTSIFTINCLLRGFLARAVGIINFAKPFLSFMGDAVLWCLDSRLVLNLSCIEHFGNLNSMMTWCINWRGLLALVFFFLAWLAKFIFHYKRIGYSVRVFRQTACLVVNPITVGNLAFLFNCRPVGRTSDSMTVLT